MHELVAIDLPGGLPLLDALRRAWDDGDAVLPLHRNAPQEMRLATAEHLGASRVVDRDGAHRIGAGRPVQDGDAVVISTSGTTGEPKGAVITHAAVEYAAFATATALAAHGDAHWLACLPLSHVGGLSVITRALHTTSRLTVHDGFNAADVDAAAIEGATHVSLVPTALGRIDASLWRRILLGGSAIPADRPSNTVATYGMTETFGGVVYDGLALNGVGVRIADTPHGDTGTTGPIELNSPTLLRCYRDGSQPFTADGWYRTGDLGSIDAVDHRLVVHGRADDLIITGGENVWPAPVEARLEQHDGVAEAAVVGRPDPEWGSRVCAVVVPANASAVPTLAELRTWVREVLPVAAAPKELELRSALPRTALGKVRRHSLATVPSDHRSEQ